MLQKVTDDPLLECLRVTQEKYGEDYWSFKNASKRRGAHALIHYPAMMVPNLQGSILAAIKEASPKVQKVLDPFVGSGTVLVESMNLGLDFAGIDINPLAFLSCSVKSGPYFVDAFTDKAAVLASNIRCDRSTRHEATFLGREKWFEADVALGISKIARNVRYVDAVWARRLFWLALARVIRACCNSRNTTYKLHIKKSADIDAEADPVKLFGETIESYKRHLRDQVVDWSEKGVLKQGRYQKSVSITAGDSTSTLEEAGHLFDIVMTSPPYGDNRTTIPYGQYAFLPLQWIPAEDISPSIEAGVLANTHALDTASLGGSAKNAAGRAEELRDEFDSIKQYLAKLSPKGTHQTASGFAQSPPRPAATSVIDSSGSSTTSVTTPRLTGTVTTALGS